MSAPPRPQLTPDVLSKRGMDDWAAAWRPSRADVEKQIDHCRRTHCAGCPSCGGRFRHV